MAGSPATIILAIRWSLMEYCGKHYTIVQGIGPQSRKWKVHLDENTIRSGEATTRAAAKTSVIWEVDRALAPKK